ncbi:MAG: RDD family protein [Nitrospirae bacterium]|nr:RDD family protein [Nitrospirota bacterium]
MACEYPTITIRYLCTVLDFLFILAIIIFTSYILQSSADITEKVRIAIILFMFFAYEPFCTSLFCTVGQKITGIRVRKMGSLQRISIPAAYLRTLIKALLGLISFFTIPLVKDRRAIHDFAVGSVVIYEKDLCNQINKQE